MVEGKNEIKIEVRCSLRKVKVVKHISFFFLWMLVASAHPLQAQWVQTSLSNPDSDVVGCFAVSGTNLFAVNDYGGVYRSTDNGTSWTPVNSGLANAFVLSLAVSGTDLFAGTVYGAGVFLSTDNGTSWTPVNSGLTNTYVLSFAVSGTNLFAGTFYGSGVFLSTNNGSSWTPVDSGLTNTNILSLAASETNLFAGTGAGVFLSTDNGTLWTPVDSGLTNTNVYSFAASGTNLFAGTDGGVFLSTNNGTSWTEVDSGLTNTTVSSFAVSGTNLFAGTDGGVFLSTNNGTSWTEVDSGLTNTFVISLAVSGANLFAGTADGGVWRRPLSELVSVKLNMGETPTRFSLSQNYPNPFNPTTTISFSLPTRSFASLKVFDIVGREVSTIVLGELQAGNYTRQWNASTFASGVVLLPTAGGKFCTDEEVAALKIVWKRQR